MNSDNNNSFLQSLSESADEWVKDERTRLCILIAIALVAAPVVCPLIYQQIFGFDNIPDQDEAPVEP